MRPHRSMEAAAGTAAAGGRPHVVGRRPTLPNGRAVTGGLLVAAAAVGTFAAWSAGDEAPSERFVVARRELPIGTVVDEADLELVAFDPPAALADGAFRHADLVVGQRTVAPLAAGDLVQRSSVVVPEGQARTGHQVSFAVDAASALAGTLEAGEAVDLLATYGSSAAESSTEVVASGAVVAGLTGSESGDQLVVLVSLPAGTDALAVTNAIRHGALTVVRSFGEPLEDGATYVPARPRTGAER